MIPNAAAGLPSGWNRTRHQPDRAYILERLIRAELFEQVLQARYLGSKRFSLEGVTALIPLLDRVLEAAAQAGGEQIVLGMSHRGRLNVMAHIAGQRAADIFAGFEDVDPRSVLGSGDVKYHVGATGEYRTRDGRKLSVHLASNPSHLEAVDPVAIGRARAKQARIGERQPRESSSDRAARRRRVCGPGRLGRDAELRRARSLFGRRHDPRDRQQLARLHDGAARSCIPRVSLLRWPSARRFPYST